ncbi:cadherin 88C [Arctopsyche grandis]|uniref:cadherin 88C n=1 Tax=Arctopsyche grandis TaxID=121162 RepID=UPI00406D693D
MVATCVAATNRPPRFLIDGQTEIVIRLKEGPDTPVGNLIYRLRGVDADGDRLQFGVRDQPGSDIFRIESTSANEANVFLAKELDREIRDEYALVLTLTDGHLGDGNFITQSILLLVEDVNDNEPVFKPYPTALSVKEDSSQGILTSVEATDLDEGAYGQVVYNLQELDGDSDVFSIQTINGRGVIRLVGELDYENKSLYQLRILAIDRANQGRVNTGTAAILVKVQDVEDQPPQFVGVTPVTRISEDSPVGTSVLKVHAIDGDRGVNNRISYSIISGGEEQFDIDRNSGVIFTINPLDREDPENNNGAYILEILATEESHTITPLPTAMTEVTIILTDVNDETPQFRSKRYICEVIENAQQNTPITFLQDAIPEVYDYDQGKNGTFELYLEGDKDVFEVTPSRGVNEASFLIRVNNPSFLDYEQVTVMNFTLIAKETVLTKPKMSVVPITVYIRDGNDNFPEFTEPMYDVSIQENCGVGTTVAWIQALDDDSGNYGTRGIRYTNLGGGISHLLSLNALSGVITVKSPGGTSFDRELVSRHFLTVEARDDLGQGNRNTVQLVINIEDVNDNAPIFLQNKYETRLLEGESDFEVPLVLEARDADLNGTRNSRIEYSIVNGDYKDNFTIDLTSGVLQPSEPMDFEQLAGDNGNVRPIQLTVRARDFGIPPLSSEVPVTIYVQDVNDHAPLFQQMIYKRSIPEDMPGGTPVLEVQAFDSDGSSPNNQVVYRIQKGAGDKFVIGSENGIISVAPGSDLDPDRTNPKSNKYTLTVIALDGGIGEQQLNAAVLVNISIVDVNNKPPVFVEPGTISVKENTQVGTYVYRAVANDPDNMPILRYNLDLQNSIAKNEEGTIVKISDYDYMTAWDLNPLDGMLRVVRLLDREKVEIIRLGIVVEDIAAVTGGDKQTASATLTIIIEDENDNNPKFRKPFYKRSITENTKNGATIANIVADDVDKNRSITYSLEGPSEMIKLVHLEPDTGEILVANKIDHETYPWLNLTVKATDSGIPPRSSLVDLFIQVLDENDNNPYFVFESTTISVLEDTHPGTPLAVIAARDSDSGEYGKITYLMDHIATKGKFSINAENGTLSVADWLDRETQSTYTLVVEAWDNYQFGYLSGESRNAFKQILIQVDDVNDNAPVLTLPRECITITEFHSVRDPIMAIHATDADDPRLENGQIVFEIVGGNEQELFQINQLPSDFSSAQIVSTKPLKDRYGNYTLTIEASDLGEPTNSVQEDMSICVTDYNDHAPLFVSPPQNVTIRIPENATVGTMVVEVHAIDGDIGPNGAVRYRLKQDATGNWRTFTIDSTSGIIKLKHPLDREKQKIYDIRVEAYDLGLPTPLSSDLDLTIYVRNVNHYRPRFAQSKMFVNFTEHSTPGEEWVKLPPVIERDEIDILDDPTVPVCYFIIRGNHKELFDLDQDSHKLTLAKEIDREIEADHSLIVHATEDCILAPKYSENEELDDFEDTIIYVYINITDINDNPPKFINEIFTGGVTTAADFGTQFMHVKALDPDNGENAQISYYQVGDIQKTLSEGLDNLQGPPFLVDKDTGAVQLNFDPQKGMKGYFDFKVLANDTGSLQDLARVFIYLLREDQRVRFVLRQHPFEVRDRVRPFRESLANVTGAIVNIDDFRIHENKDGSVDGTKTDLYLHLVNGKDHSVLEVDEVLTLVDKNIEQLDSLFKEFNVLDTQPAEYQPLTADMVTANQTVFWLVSISLFLGVLLILCVMLCLTQRANYVRQLKAATATAYETTTPGESDMTIRSMGGRVPNTNKHSTQGSNPIWLRAYENDWYKNDEDQVSQSERDSLDENVVTENIANGKPYFINTEHFRSPENSLNSDLQANQSKYNVYQQIEQINNMKNLETTEL